MVSWTQNTARTEHHGVSSPVLTSSVQAGLGGSPSVFERGLSSEDEPTGKKAIKGAVCNI